MIVSAITIDNGFQQHNGSLIPLSRNSVSQRHSSWPKAAIIIYYNTMPHLRTRNGREGARTANRVDGVQVGSRFRRELDFVHRFRLFPWFSSFGECL